MATSISCSSLAIYRTPMVRLPYQVDCMDADPAPLMCPGNGYRWDSYARMGESFWSAIPVAHTGGNHEISNGGENWVGYTYRYPNPHKASHSDSPLWYSLEVGPVHLVVLCSYADFTNGSIQARWLREVRRLPPSLVLLCSPSTVAFFRPLPAPRGCSARTVSRTVSCSACWLLWLLLCRTSLLWTDPRRPG